MPPDATRATARWFGALTRVMDVGVILLAADRRTLDFANVPACTLLGYERCEELQQHWSEIAPLLESGLERACHGEAATGTPVDVEVQADGRSRKLRFDVYRLDEQDCEGFLALLKDRDTIDTLENELALAVQMRGLTRFYMEVVHDLKAPLNAMVINLELLKDTFEPDDADRYARQRRYVDVLGDEVQRLNRSLTSLLAQTPRLAESAQRFDLRELVQELVDLIVPQAKAQRVTVEPRLPSSSVAVEGRRDRLKQALLNVAINALEAMPEGGTLGVTLDVERDAATLSIRDTGPGIPPGIVARVYDMHFTTKTGGTGIGLHVARAVVHSHGGTIDVDSAVGQGTTVRITVPVAPPATT